MARFSLRRWFERHPAVAIGLAVASLVYAVALSVPRILHARSTVSGGWLVPVVAGPLAALAAIGLVVGWFRWAVRRRVAPLRSSGALVIGMAVLFFAGIVYTRPAVMPPVGPPETVTSPVQLAAMAFMIPMYAGLAALLAWLYLWHVRRRRAGPSDRPRAYPSTRPSTQPPARRSALPKRGRAGREPPRRADRTGGARSVRDQTARGFDGRAGREP